MLCGEDNNWTSANIGRCVLRQCPELGSVDDGVLSSNETAAGTVVEITCNEGLVFFCNNLFLGACSFYFFITKIS